MDNIKQNVQIYRKRIDAFKVQRSLLENDAKEREEKQIILQQTLNNHEKARSIAQTVAENTQQKIEFHINNLVTTALAAVFPDPYEFKLRFIQRRNKTECDLLLVKNEQEIDPFSAAGGGVIDVLSFALRTAIWSIKKTRNTFILDEPMKFVSIDLQAKCSEMLKTISEKLHLQMIIVSHLPEMIRSADKIIEIK